MQPGVYIARAGVYLLTIAPATGSDGRVPTSGLGNIAATCNTRYTVEGVQFRLISISNALATELTDPGHLRNRLAYKCYGQGDTNVSGFVANPFGAVVTETIFSRPGVGRLAVDAILSRDFPLVQGTVLVAAAVYVLVNLAVDVSYAVIDPRIRYR